MSNHKQLSALIKRLSGQGNILTIPRIYIDLTGGDHLAALFLNQCVYWSDKGKREDGYFFKKYSEWQEELGLSQYQVKRAAVAIQMLAPGLLSMKLKRANSAPVVHYKLDFELLTNLIMKKLDNQETSQSDYEETKESDYEETQQSLTKTTQKITTETTVKEVAPQNGAPPEPTPKAPSAQQLMFQALADVTLMDMKLNGSRIGKAATELISAGYTPEQVTALYLPGCLWYTRDWRGQRGDPPNLLQIKDTIKALMDPAYQDAPAHKNGSSRQTVFERNMAGLNEIIKEMSNE